MITVASVGGAGAAASYYAKDNYYTDRDASEASGWAGAGAEAAALSGPVSADAFKQVLEGVLPDGTALPAGRDGKHRPGMDMTFSAPKSLSLLAYIGGDTRLLAANLAAVKTTIAWAEKNLAETRVSKDGKVETVKTGNLLVGLFQHDTNRNQEPQAHVHAVIANATQTSDGKWRALHNDKLWQHNTLLGSIYHAALKANVQALGYDTKPAGKYGMFEIAGVTRETIEAFSSRRIEILARAAATLKTTGLHALEAMRVQTRQPKAVVEDRDLLRETWRERAAAIGVDLAPLVDAAVTRANAGPAVGPWDRAAAGVRTAIERAGATASFVRERIGLGPELEPYLPRGAHRLPPGELGAANAVASAIRHLSERETSFGIYAVYKAALELDLPVQIDGVERSVARLLREGQLVRGHGTRADELTTPAALATERAIIAAAELGRGMSKPIVADANEAGRLLQAAAAERSGITLDPGQESAGRLLLAGRDRVVNVQGVAGSGKSTVLGAIAKVARDAGHNVLALGPQNTLVYDLAKDAGIDAITIAKFVYTNKSLLSARVAPDRLLIARKTFKDAIVIVDEASMSSNDQAKTLVDLANRLRFKLALVGDKAQLGAVEAGKPFEILQAAGTATAHMTENLRSRTPMLQRATALANEGKTRAAFYHLSPGTTEAPGRMSEEAAARWLAIPPADRGNTLLMASGRRVRDELNHAVQQGLLDEKSIGGQSAALTVRDSVNLTREQERMTRSYEVGQRIEFTTRIEAQRIKRGEGVIKEVDHARGVVTVERADGRTDSFEPGRLGAKRSDHSLRLSVDKAVTVHEGDMIRWTGNDKDRGLLNSSRAQITGIGSTGVTVRTASEMTMTLPHGDPMLARLDLGYAMNTHMLQGTTANRAIGVMDSRETNLTTARLFLVNMTRVRDGIELIVDSKDKLVSALERNRGDKTAALETIAEIGKRDEPVVPAARGTGAAAVIPPAASPKPPAPPATKVEIEKPEPVRIPVRELNRDRQLDLGL